MIVMHFKSAEKEKIFYSDDEAKLEKLHQQKYVSHGLKI